MNIDEAKASLQDLLDDIVREMNLLYHDQPEMTASVEYWNWDDSACGVRIAEISFANNLGGSAFLQSDGCRLLFLAEHYILDSMLGEDEGGDAAMYERMIRHELREPSDDEKDVTGFLINELENLKEWVRDGTAGDPVALFVYRDGPTRIGLRLDGVGQPLHINVKDLNA